MFRYVLLVNYIFLPPVREAKFYGVPLCVFDKLGCAASEKCLRNTGLTGLRKTK